jgi:3-hydroxy acid dehydrogenase/malonic semialdehyde reductase
MKFLTNAQAGANLILLARRQDALQKVAEACKAAHKTSQAPGGGHVAALEFDVTNKSHVAGLLDRIPAELKNVDVLVNNAGFVKGREFVGSIADVDYEDMFNTNVIGMISITQLFVRGECIDHYLFWAKQS